MNFPKPMLGVYADMSKLSYPLYVSPKYDGVRAIIKDGVVYSRSGKSIPNLATQKLFSNYHGIDGELIVGNPTSPTVYNETVSGVMKVDGIPNVRLYVFDCWYKLGNLDTRYTELLHIIKQQTHLFNESQVDIEVVKQIIVNNEDELLDYEEKQLNMGYEGIIIRNPEAKYKHGRSTVKEGALLKLKRFLDSEATIVRLDPLMRNHNEAIINALGHTERSTHKDNKVADDLLGAMLVKDIYTGVEFSIGSGFTEFTRKNLWAIGDDLLGLIIKYKHFPIGAKDKPRFPIFLGFRDKRDM